MPPDLSHERRLQVLGVVVLILAIATVTLDFRYRAQARDIQRCFHQSFTVLTDILELRGELQERESAAAQELNLVELRGVDSDEEYLAALRKYERITNEIQRERKENPVPPYPEGTCE